MPRCLRRTRLQSVEPLAGLPEGILTMPGLPRVAAFPSADDRAQHLVVDGPKQLASNPPGVAPSSAQALVHRGMPLLCSGLVAKNVMRDGGHGHSKLLS